MIPRGVLLDLARGLTNQTPTIWEGDSEPHLAIRNGKPGFWLTLDVIAYASKGVDEYRQDYDETKDVLSSSLNGVRMFTLSVKAKSYDFKDPAYELLETFRLRLRSVSARTVLEAESLALIDFPGPITPINIVADNRPIFASSMDVRFGYASTADAGDDGGGYIVTAPVTGTAST